MTRSTFALDEAEISTLPDVPASHRRMSMQRWLVEQRLGKTAPEWVRARFKAKGRNWEAAAAEMSTELGLPNDVPQVSRQLLQKWCPELVREDQ